MAVDVGVGAEEAEARCRRRRRRRRRRCCRRWRGGCGGRRRGSGRPQLPGRELQLARRRRPRVDHRWPFPTGGYGSKTCSTYSKLQLAAEVNELLFYLF
jgi:hypothetical protein